MPLSWSEIRDRAFRLPRRWADARDELSDTRPFWIDSFEIFGVTGKHVARLAYAVRRLGSGRAKAPGG